MYDSFLSLPPPTHSKKKTYRSCSCYIFSLSVLLEYHHLNCSYIDFSPKYLQTMLISPYIYNIEL